MSDQLLGIGVDGARGGWIVAAAFGSALKVPETKQVHRTMLWFARTDGTGDGLHRVSDWRSKQPGGKSAPMAIDVPIGLMELGGSRPCDTACRAALPGKASSVFPPPALFLVNAFPDGQATATELREVIESRRKEAAARGEDPTRIPGISTQSCSIFDKVCEANRLVRRERRSGRTSPAEDWVFEVHPELCFQRMHDEAYRIPSDAEAPQLAGKKSARGQLQRMALVRDFFEDAEQQMNDLEWSVEGRLDDLLDAYAALWTALRIRSLGIEGCKVLGPAHQSGMPDRDDRGLLMRIVV